SHETVAAAGLIAPAGVDHAEDHQITIHNRAHDAAAVAADPAIFLGEGVRPEYFAVPAKAQEQALHAMGVNIAGFGIGHEIRPADAIADNVGQEDVKAVLPLEFAAVRVDAQDPFLFRRAFPDIIDEIDPTIEAD